MATSGQSSTVIYDGTGAKFSIDSSGKILKNGIVDSYTANVAGMVVADGAVYQVAPDPSSESGLYGWWKYTPGSGWHNWTKVAAPPSASTITSSTYKAASDVVPSANETIVHAGSGTIRDALLNTYAVNAAGQIVINGVVDTATANVDNLAIVNGTIYQSAPDPSTGGASEGWWQYTPGSGWHNWTKISAAPIDVTKTPTTPEPVPSVPETHTPSADGTTIHAGDGAIYDESLNTFSINADGQVVLNGVADPYTNDVTSLVFENGHIFQNAGASNGWWEYTPGSGWHNWTEVTSPSNPTTPTPTPTTPTTPPTGGSSSGGSSSNGNFAEHWSRLDNGVNIERSEISKISDTELKMLAASGVENIRLFLSPDDGYLTNGKAMDPEHSSYIKYYADFMHRVNDAGMAVVVSPFGGVSRGAWQKDPSNQASIDQYASWYKEFAGYIANHFDPRDIFIESQNEPFMSDYKAWWKIEDQFLKAVHSVAPDFTFVSSSNGRNGSEWSFISSLVNLAPHDDPNVVYNVHSYSPMYFTHQGQTWSGEPFASLKNVQYTEADSIQMAKDFATLAAWADKYGVKITVNEFGASTTASESERAEFLHDVAMNADKYDFGWNVWDFNKGFSISTTDSSGNEVVKDVFQKALGWGAYQDTASTVKAAATTTTTTSTQTETVTKTLDAQFAISEKLAFSASDIGKTLIVKNFDPQSGQTMIQDNIDLSKVFDSMGGKYNDGINDVADRIAAVSLTTGDFDGNGKANDLRIAIAGLDKFSLTLIAPSTNDKALYEISDSSHLHDNIWIA